MSLEGLNTKFETELEHMFSTWHTNYLFIVTGRRPYLLNVDMRKKTLNVASIFYISYSKGRNDINRTERLIFEEVAYLFFMKIGSYAF